MADKAYDENDAWIVANAPRTAANVYNQHAQSCIREELLAPSIVDQFRRQAKEVEALATEFEQSDGFSILIGDAGEATG